MWAGMMPTLDLPGEIRPGQLGPMIRVREPRAAAWNSTASCTGIPSVITTHRPTSASTASRTASLANFGGTNTTDTSAWVAATASTMEPNTGTGSSSNRTASPALPGVTPPTMRVPDMIMRCVCLRPSLPVMPWTRTREDALMKIDIGVSSLPPRTGRPRGPPRPWCS